jgi:hypothetical protein
VLEAKHAAYREFVLLPFSAQRVVHDLHDDEGRPFGELASSAGARRGVEFVEKRCPYSGHRHGGVMNTSALHQMSEHWQAAMADCRELRGWIAKDPQQPSTMFEVWKIAIAGTAVPAFLHRRAQQPLGDGALPARVAAVFKMAVGLPLIVQRINITRSLPFDTRLPAAAYHEFAEETKTFKRYGERVCAGSPKMIDELLDALISPHDRAAATPSLADIVGDVPGFLGYLDAMTLFWLTSAAVYLQYHQVVARLVERLEASRLRTVAQRLLGRHAAKSHGLGLLRVPGAAARVLDLVRAEWARHPDAPPPARVLAGGEDAVAAALAEQQQIEEDAVRRFAWTQAKANMALGRAAPAMPLEPADLIPTFGGGVRDVVRLGG